jgi:hypothetical protein
MRRHPGSGGGEPQDLLHDRGMQFCGAKSAVTADRRTIAAWMLVRKPARAMFQLLAVGSTLQLIGGLLQH